MPEQDPQDERRATDLLPPDSPPEPEERKIAERRVVGWKLSNRLITRFERRPCGNSRRFWKQIEEDDPFKPAPILKRVRQDHTLYPTQRMDRIPSTAIPQTKPEPRAPTPQARRAVPHQEQPVHTRDLRSAPSPLPPRVQAAPAPEAPIDRRPPIIPQGGKPKTGRIRVSNTNQRPQGGAGIVQQPRSSAAEIRAQKEKDREAGTTKDHKFKNRPLDDVLSIMGQLRAMEKLAADGLLDNEARVDLPSDPNKPKPKPKQAAAPPSHLPSPKVAPLPVRPTAQTQPAPPRPAPPVDRTPPPAASKPEPPRTTSTTSGGGMNDLFGGNPNEGRVRVGKRQKTTKKE